MSSVEAKKIVVHEPAQGPGWHETIGLPIENMDPEACFQWALKSGSQRGAVECGITHLRFGGAGGAFQRRLSPIR